MVAQQGVREAFTNHLLDHSPGRPPCVTSPIETLGETDSSGGRREARSERAKVRCGPDRVIELNSMKLQRRPWHAPERRAKNFPDRREYDAGRR